MPILIEFPFPDPEAAEACVAVGAEVAAMVAAVVGAEVVEVAAGLEVVGAALAVVGVAPVTGTFELAGEQATASTAIVTRVMANFICLYILSSL